MLNKKIKYLLLCTTCSLLCACSNSNTEFEHITSEGSDTVTIDKSESQENNKADNQTIDADMVENIEYSLTSFADIYEFKDEDNNDFYVEDLKVADNIYYKELYETFEETEFPNEEIVYENEHFTVVLGLVPGYEYSPAIISIEPKDILENDWRQNISKNLDIPYYDVVMHFERCEIENYEDINNDYVFYKVELPEFYDNSIFKNIVLPDNVPYLDSASFLLQYKDDKYHFVSTQLGYKIINALENSESAQTGIEEYQEEIRNNIEDIKSDAEFQSLLLYSEWETMDITYLDEFGLIKFENENATIYMDCQGIYSSSVYAEYYDENIKKIADSLGISTWELDLHSKLARNDDILYYDENQDEHVYDRETGEKKDSE